MHLNFWYVYSYSSTHYCDRWFRKQLSSLIQRFAKVRKWFTKCVSEKWQHLEWQLGGVSRKHRTISDGRATKITGAVRTLQLYILMGMSLTDQYFKSQQHYLNSGYIIQLIAFQWAAACTSLTMQIQPTPAWITFSIMHGEGRLGIWYALCN